MAIAVKARRKEVEDAVKRNLDKLGDPAEGWIAVMDDPEKAAAAAAEVGGMVLERINTL